MDKKRLTLDLDATLQRRLKVAAAIKGVSMRAYCQAAIENALEREEGQALAPLPFGPDAVARLRALQSKAPGGGPFPGDSTEFIRAAREQRSASQ